MFSQSELFNEFKPQPLMIRDFMQVITQATYGQNITLSLVQRFNAAGLDFALYNRGIANLTLQIDGQAIDTVIPNGTRFSNGIKYDRIAITSTTEWTLYIAGVHLGVEIK